MIYGFLGPEPLYGLPQPRGFVPSVVSRSAAVDLDAPIDVAGINLFDMQHLESIHHRALSEPPRFAFEGHGVRALIRARVVGDTLHDRVLRLFGVREAGINADCWGGNDFFFYYKRFDLCARMGFLPLSLGRCRMFLSVMGGARWGGGALAVGAAVPEGGL